MDFMSTDETPPLIIVSGNVDEKVHDPLARRHAPLMSKPLNHVADGVFDVGGNEIVARAERDSVAKKYQCLRWEEGHGRETRRDDARDCANLSLGRACSAQDQTASSSVSRSSSMSEPSRLSRSSGRQPRRQDDRLGSASERHMITRGSWSGHKIEMWCNKTTRTIETAYPMPR